MDISMMTGQQAMAHARALNRVTRERERQIAKWGDQGNNDAMTWCAILGEETGEVCKAALDSRPGSLTGHATLDDLRRELVQVAAVAVAWLEQLDASR